jgi:hypothetical protein
MHAVIATLATVVVMLFFAGVLLVRAERKDELG